MKPKEPRRDILAPPRKTADEMDNIKVVLGGKGDWSGPERRQSDRRREERRGLVPGITYSSTYALVDIFDWLDTRCTGKWRLTCQGQGGKKGFDCWFEDDSDREAFMEMLAAFAEAGGEVLP